MKWTKFKPVEIPGERVSHRCRLLHSRCYDACHLIPPRQQRRVDCVEVTRGNFRDRSKSRPRFMANIGTFRRGAALRVRDFPAYKAALPAAWDKETTDNEIQRIQTVFKWAFESELIPAMRASDPTFASRVGQSHVMNSRRQKRHEVENSTFSRKKPRTC